MTTPYKTCPACGQNTVPTTAICGRCGYAYTGLSQTGRFQTAPRPRRSPLGKIAAAGLCIALLAVSGLFLMPQRQKAQMPLIGSWEGKGDNGVHYIFRFDPAEKLIVTEEGEKIGAWIHSYHWENTGHTLTLRREDNTSASSQRYGWDLSNNDALLTINAENARDFPRLSLHRGNP